MESYQAKAADAKKSGGWFKANNSLIEGGWLLKLTHRQVRVVIAMLYYQNFSAEGICFAGAEKIATITGIPERHVRRTISELTKLELVEAVESGGGRANLAHRRIVFPPSETVAAIATVSQSGTSESGATAAPVSPSKPSETVAAVAPLSQSETGADLALNRGRRGTETVAAVAPLSQSETGADLALNRGRRGTETGAAVAPRLKTPDSYAEIKTQRAGGAGTDDAAELPAGLATPEFRAAWADYLRHRRERRSKLTPTAESRLITRLAGWGANRAVLAIQRSIENGWLGVFDRDGDGGSTASAGAGQRDQLPFAPPGAVDPIEAAGAALGIARAGAKSLGQAVTIQSLLAATADFIRSDEIVRNIPGLLIDRARAAGPEPAATAERLSALFRAGYGTIRGDAFPKKNGRGLYVGTPPSLIPSADLVWPLLELRPVAEWPTAADARRRFKSGAPTTSSVMEVAR